MRALHDETYRRRNRQVQVLPGAAELLAFLTQRGVPFAIATSGYLESAKATIELLRLPEGPV